MRYLELFPLILRVILRSGEKNAPFNVILLELQCLSFPPYLGEICLNPRSHMGTPQLHGCDAGNICQLRLSWVATALPGLFIISSSCTALHLG